MATEKQICWKQAWRLKRFRSLFLFGAVGLFVTVLLWPIFLGHIEKRNGVVLHDAIMAWMPAKDLSIPIFACLWGAALLMLVRILQQPKLFLMFMYSYWMLFMLRMLTIQIIPLDPPVGLLKLRDPISNLFYGNGGMFITKDLFFSGHTATLILICLFLKNKWEKRFVFFAAIAVGIMVLFQRIHYSIDVLFAPLFAFVIYFMVQKWLGDMFQEAKSVKEVKQKSFAS